MALVYVHKKNATDSRKLYLLIIFTLSLFQTSISIATLIAMLLVCCLAWGIAPGLVLCIILPCIVEFGSVYLTAANLTLVILS